MNAVKHPSPHQQGSPPGPQFQNICKICKKVYKDKSGLMDHQRQQHSQQPISIAQQIQKLQMNRLNRELQKKTPSFSNGNNSGVNIARMESYATLEKPPASLQPKLQQSRKQQFQNSNGNSVLIEEPDNNEAGQDPWKRWEPEKEKDTMIISADVAQSTADCYYLPGNNNANRTKSHPQPESSSSPIVNYRPPIITPSTSGIHLNKQQNLKSRLNPQMLSKIQQSVSSSGNSLAMRNQQSTMSPNGKGGINRAPIPKLMSKTKAQFQILKSQVTRPKTLPKSGVNNALPKTNLIADTNIPGNNPRLGVPMSGPAATSARLEPPKLTKMENPSSHSDEIYNCPPRLHRESDLKASRGGFDQGKRGGRGGNRLPPPSTRPLNSFENSSGQSSSTNVSRGNSSRGSGNRGRETNRGRGLPPRTTPIVRRESLHSPTCSGSESDSDGYGYSTPSPPPPKKFRSGGSPNRVPNNPVAKKISAAAAKQKIEDERVYGKEYKCPPMDKVASYLTKKGVRIWICLVCEETEQEISRGPMICCDGCEDWYHFFCVGIEVEPPENEKWFCKRCIYKKLHNKKTVGRGGMVSPSPSDSIDSFSSSPKAKSKPTAISSPSPKKTSPAPKNNAGKGRPLRGRPKGK